MTMWKTGRHICFTLKKNGRFFLLALVCPSKVKAQERRASLPPAGARFACPGEKGTSLIELLVGMALLGVVITAAAAAVVYLFQYYHQHTMEFSSINDSRQALIRITEEIRRAGEVTVEEESGEIYLNGEEAVIKMSQENGESRIVKEEGGRESVIMFDAETFEVEMILEGMGGEEGDGFVKVVLGRERLLESVTYVK